MVPLRDIASEVDAALESVGHALLLTLVRPHDSAIFEPQTDADVDAATEFEPGSCSAGAPVSTGPAMASAGARLSDTC